eukprot:SAG31_NODE_201_length_20535_cov_15.315081_9_plen_53_part_00
MDRAVPKCVLQQQLGVHEELERQPCLGGGAAGATAVSCGDFLRRRRQGICRA